MASTSVVFDILAKDRASDKFDHLGRSVDGTSSKMSALTGVLKNAGKVAVVGLAAGLAGAGYAAIKFGEAAAQDEQAAALLADALRNNAGATDEQVAATERWITAQGKALGVTDDELRPALGALVTATHDVGDAQKLASLAMDVSAARGKSLQSVSEALMKAQNGNVAALSRLGIKTKNAAGETITMEQAVKRMSDQFGGAAAAKAGTFQGKMDRLKVVFNETKEAIGAKLIPVVSDFADLLLKKVVPNVGPVLSALEDIAKIGWEKFQHAAGAVKDFFKNGEGHAALAASIDAIKNSAQKIKDGFEGARDGVQGLFEAIQNGDSEQLGQLLGEAIASALETFLNLAGKVTEALAKMFAKVDWVGLGITIGKYVPALLLGLATGILNFDPAPIFKGIKEHWGEILLATLAIAFAPSKLAGGLGKILAKIPFVGKFLERAVLWLNELGSKLASFGGDLLQAMWRGFTGGKALPGVQIVTKFLDALKGIPGAVRDFIGTLGTKLGVWSLDAFEAFGKSARTKMDGVVRYLGTLAAKFLSAIGDLGKLLWNAGVSLIQGLIDGITSRIDDVERLLSSLASKAASAFKNTLGIHSPSLVFSKAGADLIAGLVQGIEKGKVKLTVVLEKLTDYIKKHHDKLSKLQGMKSAIVDAFKGFASSIFGADTGESAHADRLAQINDLLAQQADIKQQVVDGTLDQAEAEKKLAAIQGKIGGIQAEDAAQPRGLAALLAFQKQQRAKAEGLKADVGTLISKGISKDLLTQLQNAGAAGEEQIHLLATGTVDEIKQANEDNAATLQALQDAGLAAAKAQGLDAQIKAEENAIKQAEIIKGALKELLDEQDKNTVVELHLDGHRILWSLKKIKKQNGGHLGLGDKDND